MDHAPWLDAPDQWNPTRVRLADMNGNGVSDILYLGVEGVSIYRNQSGNSWTKCQLLNVFPVCKNLSQVQVVDWRTISGDNINSMYGLGFNSRITDSNDSTRVFSWLLCSVQGDLGSRYEIEYKLS
jgi:hypothetical protein